MTKYRIIDIDKYSSLYPYYNIVINKKGKIATGGIFKYQFIFDYPWSSVYGGHPFTKEQWYYNDGELIIEEI